jgi:hypothetical protein
MTEAQFRYFKRKNKGTSNLKEVPLLQEWREID